MGTRESKKVKAYDLVTEGHGQIGTPQHGGGNSGQSRTTRNPPLGGLAAARVGKSESLIPGSHRISIVYRQARGKVKKL
jgi:hypothetical protein